MIKAYKTERDRMGDSGMQEDEFGENALKPFMS